MDFNTRYRRTNRMLTLISRKMTLHDEMRKELHKKNPSAWRVMKLARIKGIAETYYGRLEVRMNIH